LGAQRFRRKEKRQHLIAVVGDSYQRLLETCKSPKPSALAFSSG
jgi:hypothetical protein